MKRPSPYVDRRGDASMDSTMTPMIDVVFLLLVFFVWTASFQLAVAGLDIPVNDARFMCGRKPVDQIQKDLSH